MSQACCGGVQMFKNMRLAILFDMFLNPSFKMTSFANIARTAASTSKFIYTRKYFTSSGIGFIYEKKNLILNELKTSLMLKFSLQNSLQSVESLFLIWCQRLPVYGNLK